MKKNTKAKWLAVLTIPFLLSGCAAASAPRPIVLADATSAVRGLAGGAGNQVVIDAGGGGGGSSTSNYTSTGYPSFYGTESITSKLNTGTLSAPSDSTRSYDSGVKVYGNGTSTSVGSTNAIKLNSRSPFFDFSDVAWTAPSSITSVAAIVLISGYKLEVYSGSYRRFIANAYIENDVGKLNKNGTITDTTINTSTGIVPSELGKIASSLSNGSYTVKVTVSFMWSQVNTTTGQMGIFESTGTTSGTLLIDATAPTVSMTSGDKTIANGGVSNAAITFNVSDTNPQYIYYKSPAMSSYMMVSYGSGATSYTGASNNGVHSLYAVDGLGNKSETVSATVDTIKPAGNLYVNGTSASSGSYSSSSFSYVATDGGTGVKACYYKTPSSSSYVQYSSGSIVPSDSGDGWYEFYSVDNAGNQSETLKIFLETGAETLSICRNGSQVFTGSAKSGGSIDTGLYFNSGDSIRFGYTSPSGYLKSTTYGLKSEIALSDSAFPLQNYSETVVNPFGVSTSFAFKIVKEKPYITVNGVRHESGSTLYLNEDVDVLFGMDGIITSGSAKAKVTSSGSTNEFDMLSQKSASLTASDDEEKSYSINLTDPAGNASDFTIIVDKSPVKAIWHSGDSITENGGYTNKSSYLSFSDEGATATFSKDGGEFASYVPGTLLNEDGSYTVIIVDRAGNKSEFRLTIDTVAPTGTIYAGGEEARNGLVTNKAVYFTWDGDATCLLNGSDYKKNAVVDSEGEMSFVLTDKAGNSSSYSVTIDRTAPEGNDSALKGDGRYAISRWFEAKEGDATKKFGTEAEALSDASLYEKETYVSAKTLDDPSKFTETSMVADNGDPDDHSDEPRAGVYWLYKSKANANILLYYFDESLLNDAIAHYASELVSGPFHYEGGDASLGVSDPVCEVDGESLPIGNGYILSNFGSKEAYALKRGSDVKIALQYGIALDKQLTESGVYDITETDEAGNSCTYSVAMDFDAPGMKAIVSTYGSDPKEITVGSDSLPSAGTYYLKSFSVGSLLDSDSWSTVSVTTGDSVSYYSKGDAMPTLDKGGTYLIKAYDRIGNSMSFTVVISDQEEEVSFANNADDTSVSVAIEMGDANETITSLEIYRNGQKMSGVSADKLDYAFSKDGLYKVVLKDNFGRTITKEYRFAKALPQGTLTGVSEGGKTSGDVLFSYDESKYYAEVSKDGSVIATDRTGSVSLSETGSYSIKLINLTDDENVRAYSFSIDKQAPSVSIDGVSDGGTTNGSVTASWEDGDVASATYSVNGGERIPFESGTVFSKEGTYVITITDDMGNVTTKTFTIDKTVDYSVTTSDGKKIGGDATTSSDVTITSGEPSKITVIKDGESYPYEFGDVLFEEGNYLITVEDGCGNKTSFTIVIDKTVDFGMNAADGGISNDPVTITSGESETVVVTKDGEAYQYEAGQTISEEGHYVAVITDAYGNSKTVSFTIVSGAKTSLDYQLGGDVEIVSVTKDGTPISVSGNHLSFTEDGTYVVVIKEGGKEYTFTLILDTTAPEVTLNGVDDGGSVDGSVTITGMSEEGTVQVYKDGELIDYKLGDELKDYGHYKVVVTDALGNARAYEFTLAFQMNVWAIVLIALGGVAALSVTVTIVAKRKRLFKK